MSTFPDTGKTRWLVLAGQLAPYMRELWRKVASLDGNDVRIVAVPRTDWASHQHERSPVTHDQLVAWTASTHLRTAHRLIREFRPTVVVTLGHQFVYQIVSSAFAAFAGVARRVYCADTNIFDLEKKVTRPEKAKNAAKRLLLPAMFTQAFSLGETNTRALKATGFRRVEQIPVYAVDFQELGAGREALGSEDRDRWNSMKRPRHLVVARLVVEKNLQNLVRAWVGVVDSQAGSLTLIGEGPERRALEAIGRYLPADRLWITGSRRHPTVGCLLSEADDMLMPSTKEPWGIVVTEALGLGIPVVANATVGSAASLADAAGEAICLTGQTVDDWVRALSGSEHSLEVRRQKAAVFAARIRELYGLEAVAIRLSEWGRLR